MFPLPGDVALEVLTCLDPLDAISLLKTSPDLYFEPYAWRVVARSQPGSSALLERAETTEQERLQILRTALLHQNLSSNEPHYRSVRFLSIDEEDTFLHVIEGENILLSQSWPVALRVGHGGVTFIKCWDLATGNLVEPPLRLETDTQRLRLSVKNYVRNTKEPNRHQLLAGLIPDKAKPFLHILQVDYSRRQSVRFRQIKKTQVANFWNIETQVLCNDDNAHVVSFGHNDLGSIGFTTMRLDSDVDTLTFQQWRCVPTGHQIAIHPTLVLLEEDYIRGIYPVLEEGFRTGPTRQFSVQVRGDNNSFRCHEIGIPFPELGLRIFSDRSRGTHVVHVKHSQRDLNFGQLRTVWSLCLASSDLATGTTPRHWKAEKVDEKWFRSPQYLYSTNEVASSGYAMLVLGSTVVGSQDVPTFTPFQLCSTTLSFSTHELRLPPSLVSHTDATNPLDFGALNPIIGDGYCMDLASGFVLVRLMNGDNAIIQY